jgi:Uma2 family endonuclease
MAIDPELPVSILAMKTRATYDDLLAVPDHKVAEIVDGELFVSPRPASPHARTSSVLGVEIGAPFDRGRGGPGGWWVLDEPELHFGEDVLVPDLAAWRRERMTAVPNARFFTLVPDWVCEVASPSTEYLDRRRKRPIYAREGVGHLWIVNPLTRTLVIHRRIPEGWLVVATHGGDERVRAEPFDAIELDLAALWIDTTASG